MRTATTKSVHVTFVQVSPVKTIVCELSSLVVGDCKVL